MNFIKKFLGIKSDNAQEIKSQFLKKENILDFFKTDPLKIPDESYIKGEIEFNSAGQEVCNYRKNLDYLEFGIFDTVEIKIIENNSKNIFYKTFKAKKVRMDNLRKLIDDIYMIYGSDNNHKSKFSNKDLNEYKSNDLSILFGRAWTDFPKYKYPITIDKFEGELTLSIFGLEHSEN